MKAVLEPLEHRILLVTTLNGVPDWVSQGPAPIQQAGTQIPPFSPATGAIQSLAVHPGNPDIMYVGSVNGGVWRTTNATTGALWLPLTDQFPSLSIGSVALSPLADTLPMDHRNDVVYAATGAFSAFANVGGRGGLVMKTVNGGDRWELMPAAPFAGMNVTDIVPTRIGTGPVASGGTFSRTRIA